MTSEILVTGETPRLVAVYALRHPVSGEVRYIGQTVKKIGRRLTEHLQAARRRTGTHVACWILSLEGEPPRIDILAVVPESLADRLEVAAIAHFRSAGYRLTNLTDGGDGVRGIRPTAEAVAKRAASNTGKRHTPETRARMSVAKKGIPRSPEHCANLSAAAKARRHSPETRAKMAVAGRGRKRPPFSEEWRAKISVAHKGRVLSAEHRAKISASLLNNQRARRIAA